MKFIKEMTDEEIKGMIIGFSNMYFKAGARSEAFRIIATAALITKPEECYKSEEAAQFTVEYRDYKGACTNRSHTSFFNNVFLTNKELDSTNLSGWVKYLAHLIDILIDNESVNLVSIRMNDYTLYEAPSAEEFKMDFINECESNNSIHTCVVNKNDISKALQSISFEFKLFVQSYTEKKYPVTQRINKMLLAAIDDLINDNVDSTEIKLNEISNIVRSSELPNRIHALYMMLYYCIGCLISDDGASVSSNNPNIWDIVESMLETLTSFKAIIMDEAKKKCEPKDKSKTHESEATDDDIVNNANDEPSNTYKVDSELINRALQSVSFEFRMFIQSYIENKYPTTDNLNRLLIKSIDDYINRDYKRCTTCLNEVRRVIDSIGLSNRLYVMYTILCHNMHRLLHAEESKLSHELDVFFVLKNMLEAVHSVKALISANAEIK